WRAAVGRDRAIRAGGRSRGRATGTAQLKLQHHLDTALDALTDGLPAPRRHIGRRRPLPAGLAIVVGEQPGALAVVAGPAGLVEPGADPLAGREAADHDVKGGTGAAASRADAT